MPSLSPGHAEEMSDVVLLPLLVDWMIFVFLKMRKIRQLPLSSKNHCKKALNYGFNLFIRHEAVLIYFSFVFIIIRFCQLYFSECNLLISYIFSSSFT